MPRRKKFWLFVCLALFLSGPGERAGAANLDTDQAAAFLQGLLDHPDSMTAFLDPEDLDTAGRLGISYRETSCKPLISWTLSPPNRERLEQEGLDGRFAVADLGGGFSRLTLFPTEAATAQNWIFRDGQLVSSILYQVRNWKRIDSPHFRFFISDTTRFHPANIEALENFLGDTAELLDLTAADRERLKSEKIYYCFCSSQEEIQELTGFQARGMYIVSHDIVVSTYSAHFHELAHLLMNFKLQRPHLYTHPFFLEGFAVAVGGRGGKAPDILHQMGLSLFRQGWLSVDELLSTENFYRVNASMSYPGSAVYNRFLLEEMPLSRYLELYSRHGGDAQTWGYRQIRPDELPAEQAWKSYLVDQPQEGAIRPGAPELETTDGPVTFHPLPGETHFGFAVPDTYFVFDGSSPRGYRSFLYEEFFPEAPYGGQRYFIRASSGEAAVYDLFTNTMLALYASGFTTAAAEIPASDGRYLFRVDRSVFSREPAKE